MISKEEYVLNRVKAHVEHKIKQDEMINPIRLDNLIKQLEFDYDMDKEYNPENLK